MKKCIILFLLAALMLAGCSNESDAPISESNYELIQFHNISFELSPGYEITQEADKVQIIFETQALMNIVFTDWSGFESELLETIPAMVASNMAASLEDYAIGREQTTLEILDFTAEQIELEMQSGDMSGISILLAFMNGDMGYSVTFTDATGQYQAEYEHLLNSLKSL